MLTRMLLCALLALSFAAAAGAETYPDRPVTIIVPFAAGGSVDMVARFAGQALQEKLKQPFVIDFRPGANSRLAPRSSPDPSRTATRCCSSPGR